MNFVGEISRCNRRSFRKNVYIFHLFEFFSLEKPTQPSILEYSGFQVVVNRLKRLRMLLSHHFCCCRCFDSICRDYNYQFEWAIDAINLIIRGFFLAKTFLKQKFEQTNYVINGRESIWLAISRSLIYMGRHGIRSLWPQRTAQIVCIQTMIKQGQH